MEYKTRGGVYKNGRRKQRPYHWRVQHEGQTVTGAARTKTEAQEERARALAELRNPSTSKTPTGTTFSEAANAWFDHCLTHSTEDHYYQCKKRFQKYLALYNDVKALDLTPAMVDTLLMSWSTGVSNHVANRNLVLLKAILTHAASRAMIPFNPILHTKKLPEKKARKYVPPAEDVAAVLLRAGARDRAILQVYLGTGARKRELFDLRWSDVKFRQRFLVLHTRKKKGGDAVGETVGMNDDVYEALKYLKGNQLSDEWVFPSPTTGKPYYDRNKWLAKLCSDAGIKHFSLHALRHYGAALMYNRGATMAEIQRQLRHEKATTTERYLKSLMPPDQATAEYLSDPLATGEKAVKKKAKS